MVVNEKNEIYGIAKKFPKHCVQTIFQTNYFIVRGPFFYFHPNIDKYDAVKPVSGYKFTIRTMSFFFI